MQAVGLTRDCMELSLLETFETRHSGEPPPVGLCFETGAGLCCLLSVREIDGR